MARQRQTKKPIRRPGWAEAARDLGVTFSHLRRVLLGERPGKSLKKKFRTWQRDQRAFRRTHKLIAKSLPPLAARIAADAAHLAATAPK